MLQYLGRGRWHVQLPRSGGIWWVVGQSSSTESRHEDLGDCQGRWTVHRRQDKPSAYNRLVVGADPQGQRYLIDNSSTDDWRICSTTLMDKPKRRTISPLGRKLHNLSCDATKAAALPPWIRLLPGMLIQALAIIWTAAARVAAKQPISTGLTMVKKDFTFPNLPRRCSVPSRSNADGKNQHFVGYETIVSCKIVKRLVTPVIDGVPNEDAPQCRLFINHIVGAAKYYIVPLRNASR